MVLTTVQEHQQREAQMQKKGARAHTHPTPCDCAAVHIQATVLDPIAMANTVEREFYHLLFTSRRQRKRRVGAGWRWPRPVEASWLRAPLHMCSDATW